METLAELLLSDVVAMPAMNAMTAMIKYRINLLMVTPINIQ